MANSASTQKLRVLVLSKRQYTSRDLLDDRYGRLRELPLALSTCGARVEGLCLSYRPRAEMTLADEGDSGCVAWTSRNIFRLFPTGSFGYWRTVNRIGGELRPDIVWACSDTLHAALGVAVARRLGAKLVIDLYDNFESFPLARIPGVNVALRRAIRAADGVTCVSAPLREKVCAEYGYQGPIETIENAIPTGMFVRRDQAAARADFALPQRGLFIGTAGALSRGRGTEFLFEAFLRLAKQRDDVHLVLAGPLDPDLALPAHDRVHFLGHLPPDRVPLFLSTLDISVVCNKDSPFGRYCFPQKLYESLSVGVPVAVAGVGAVADLLHRYPFSLYQPDDVESLLAVLIKLCETPVVPDIPIPTWGDQGVRLHRFLECVSNSGPG